MIVKSLVVIIILFAACVYCCHGTVQIFSIFSASGAACTLTVPCSVCNKYNLYVAIDKRFVSVEAKIEAKMNCRIFDIFDLTEDLMFGIWFGVILDVMWIGWVFM